MWIADMRKTVQEDRKSPAHVTAAASAARQQRSHSVSVAFRISICTDQITQQALFFLSAFLL